MQCGPGLYWPATSAASLPASARNPGDHRNARSQFWGTADGRDWHSRLPCQSVGGWWWLKKWIDRRWMAKYTDLSMLPPPPADRLVGLNGGITEAPRDPAFEVMRCLGCGKPGMRPSRRQCATQLQPPLPLALMRG